MNVLLVKTLSLNWVLYLDQSTDRLIWFPRVPLWCGILNNLSSNHADFSNLPLKYLKHISLILCKIHGWLHKSFEAVLLKILSNYILSVIDILIMILLQDDIIGKVVTHYIVSVVKESMFLLISMD